MKFSNLETRRKIVGIINVRDPDEAMFIRVFLKAGMAETPIRGHIMPVKGDTFGRQLNSENTCDLG